MIFDYCYSCLVLRSPYSFYISLLENSLPWSDKCPLFFIMIQTNKCFKDFLLCNFVERVILLGNSKGSEYEQSDNKEL